VRAVPLIIDLIRHGEAGPSGPHGDAARTLTPGGREAIARLGRERLAVDRPDHLFASPLTRAQESARLLLDGVDPPVPIETLDALTPDHDPVEVVSALAPLDLTGHVVLVGHQPLLGSLVAYLAGGRDREMATASLVRIEFSERLARGRGRILFESR
jgi:phosphohistidine phosphatase